MGVGGDAGWEGGKEVRSGEDWVMLGIIIEWLTVVFNIECTLHSRLMPDRAPFKRPRVPALSLQISTPRVLLVVIMHYA